MYRKQQREKLKIFNLEKLFEAQKKEHHEQLRQSSPSTANSVEQRTKPVINPKRNKPINSDPVEDKVRIFLPIYISRET